MSHQSFVTGRRCMLRLHWHGCIPASFRHLPSASRIYIYISPSDLLLMTHTNSGLRRDRSGQRWQPSGKPYVVAATKACSRLIRTCRELSPPSSPTPSLPLSLVGVFLNVILSFAPFSLVCPWTLAHSWEHLSPSSLFTLSLFSPFCLSPLAFVPECSLAGRLLVADCFLSRIRMWVSWTPAVASLLLVVRPGAPSSVLAPSSDARSP